MNDRHPELGRLGPERIVLGQREILAVDVPANRGAAQAEAPDAVLELLGGQLGMLQGHRRRRDEAVGMRRHPSGQSLVLRPHDPAGQLEIGRVPPEAVDGQRLDVDTLVVHDREPRRTEEAVAAAAPSSSGVPFTMSSPG